MLQSKILSQLPLLPTPIQNNLQKSVLILSVNHILCLILPADIVSATLTPLPSYSTQRNSCWSMALLHRNLIRYVLLRVYEEMSQSNQQSDRVDFADSLLYFSASEPRLHISYFSSPYKSFSFRFSELVPLALSGWGCHSKERILRKHCPGLAEQGHFASQAAARWSLGLSLGCVRFVKGHVKKKKQVINENYSIKFTWYYCFWSDFCY